MWWLYNHQELVVFSSCKFLILLRLRPCWSENKNVFETFQNLLCKCYYNNYCLMLLPSCFLLFMFTLKFGLLRNSIRGVNIYYGNVMEKETQLVTLCFDLQLWLFESDVYLGKENWLDILAVVFKWPRLLKVGFQWAGGGSLIIIIIMTLFYRYRYRYSAVCDKL